MVVTLVVSVVLAILVSSTCSLLEAALYSLTPGQVEMLGKDHPRLARQLHRLRERIDEPITAILTLNTVANTIGAAVAGAAALVVFGQERLAYFSISFTLAILIFSEILPKTVGVVYARPLAPYIAWPLTYLVFLLKPAIGMLRWVTRLIPGHGERQTVSREEVMAIAKLSSKTGQIDDEQLEVIFNILQLREKSVREVMTPRTVTFALEKSMTVAEAIGLEEKWRIHSRVPVYDREFDNIIGLILTKDVFMAASAGRGHLELFRLMHPVHFVPETAPLNEVLIQFFERHQHLFVVVDEYGSVTGVISMEDIIEEIVGREIVDESDKARDLREVARTVRRSRL